MDKRPSKEVIMKLPVSLYYRSFSSMNHFRFMMVGNFVSQETTNVSMVPDSSDSIIGETKIFRFEEGEMYSKDKKS